jgi:hypothetical protein
MPKSKPAARSGARVTAPTSKPATAAAGRITVENVNVPGHTTTVDAGKYLAMKKALLRVLPRRAPGLTQAEMFTAVVPHLPQALFPQGATAGWWVKCVQLDLEAKRQIEREPSKPLRWHTRSGASAPS